MEASRMHHQMLMMSNGRLCTGRALPNDTAVEQGGFLSTLLSGILGTILGVSKELVVIDESLYKARLLL